MTETVFIEAFGSPSTTLGPGNIDSQAEDLYSVFRARSELMGWYASPRTAERHGTLLWMMNEAELTRDDECRVGYGQVGFEFGIPLTRAIPALVQCFVDSVRRFGRLQLSGLQITAFNLEPTDKSCLGDLVSMTNWFNLRSGTEVDMVIVLDRGMIGEGTVEDVLPMLQRWNTSPFEFLQIVDVFEQHFVTLPSEVPDPCDFSSRGFGLMARLPERTICALSWAVALVADAVRMRNPGARHVTIRVPRIRIALT